MAHLHHLSREIIKCAYKSNGIVFGGAVRNKVAHDSAADDFYYKCINDMADRTLYSDATYDVETKDRLLVDKDVDVFFVSESDVVAFKQRMVTDSRLWLSRSKDPRGSWTKTNIGNVDCGLTTGIVRIEQLFCAFHLPNVVRRSTVVEHVKVDIVIGIQGSMPPFNLKIDLECNGLMLGPDNEFKLLPCMTKDYTTPSKKLSELNRIVEDIKAHRTILVSSNVADFRITKLVKKKWTITGRSLSITHCPKDPDDLCMFCHEPLPNNEPFIQLKCCKGSVHGACAQNWIRANNAITVPRTVFSCPCPCCGLDNFALYKADQKLIECASS